MLLSRKRCDPGTGHTLSSSDARWSLGSWDPCLFCLRAMLLTPCCTCGEGLYLCSACSYPWNEVSSHLRRFCARAPKTQTQDTVVSFTCHLALMFWAKVSKRLSKLSAEELPLSHDHGSHICKRVAIELSLSLKPLFWDQLAWWLSWASPSGYSTILKACGWYPPKFG